ncbi:hypothetical protein SAMN02745119_00517 [Trichlorobacter thiogenes]|uniref:Uncharacterized protein n=2 Tax=Trichlorobacter thiogenes TaxID=115783 RepID=A0A1T4KF49_9BACT|nr:hypothetical protein SAMN02745119_00517 [Trichlorobacter thiogenes]
MRGWQRPMRRTSLICLALIALLPATARASGEQLPDAEFLEFLGRYETSTGKAIDPLQFAEQDTDQQKKEQDARSRQADRKKQLYSRKKPQKDQDYEK